MRKRFPFLDLTENERKGYLFLLILLVAIVFFHSFIGCLNPNLPKKSQAMFT